MTYSLASQGVFSVSPPLVESVIALTIVITSIFEIRNFHPKLWQECLIVFGFGLFHGLGFASAMSTITNESRFPIISILGFNLGIEFGQIITSLAILLVLLAFKQFPPLYRNTPRVIAIFSLLVGCYWFVERLFFQ
jgi:hydrogenase/urease accessory protein HupE